MTIRQHLLSGDAILFATERAGRPNAFADEAVSECPFCPGNEALTPPTIAAADTPWQARAFANKYPAVEGHEVIVESPRHDDTFDRVPNAEPALRLSLERYAAHDAAAHIALFKNHGRMAGASLAHIHSQLMPLPFVPPRIARESAGFAGRCPLCEPHAAGFVIAETEAFTWLAPHGSTMVHQSWIVPKQHAPEPDAASPHIAELASLLQRASAAMLGVTAAYNWSFTAFRGEPRAHWYVDLFPRLTTVAGFELGTGTFIAIIDPAVTAERFRPFAPQR